MDVAVTDKTSTVFKAKLKLDAQLYELNTAIGSISNVVDFADTTLKKGSDVEVLMYKKELIARAAALCQTLETLPLAVTEEVNISDSEVLKNFGKLCQAPCAKQSQVVALLPGHSMFLSRSRKKNWEKVWYHYGPKNGGLS